MSPEIIVGKPERLAESFAARFAGEARQALAASGRFAIALPGGSAASLLFPALAALPLDFSRLDFFWGDERAVPAGHPDSNHELARALWLEPCAVPEARIHRMPADAADLEAAATSYARELASVLQGTSGLDLALLGMGPDGHVCSLFPGHPLLREERRFVAPVEDSPKPPPRRLTLTLPALAAAELVVVAATGEAKAKAIREAVHEERSLLPVALVMRRARRGLYLLDETAARLL